MEMMNQLDMQGLEDYDIISLLWFEKIQVFESLFVHIRVSHGKKYYVKQGMIKAAVSRFDAPQCKRKLFGT